MKHWTVTTKEVGNPKPVVTRLDGDYELEDVRDFLGLEEPDVEWYTIEPVKGGEA